MALVQSLITSDKYSIKCPYSMSPIGICVHNTANDAPAKNEISYMKSNNNEVSFHIAIDDVEAIQGIPFDRNAWAAGDGGSGNGNRKYIHIEICYSKSGGAKFTEAENRAAKEIAALLKQFGWGLSAVKKHQDFSGKYCPHRTLDMGWQRFLNMIQAELDGPSTSQPSGIMYRVVCGSYTERANAEAMKAKLAADGYSAFLDAFVKDGVSYLRVIAGSYSVKENADKIMNELNAKGYSAFLAVYGSASAPSEPTPPPAPTPTPPPAPSCDTELQRYAENGRCTITASAIRFRDKPCTCHGVQQGTYDNGESLNYDLVVITERYVWISWIGRSSGTRRYMPIKDKSTGERWGNCV